MKALILLPLFFAIAFSTVVPRVTPIVSHVPLTYKLNLDDPVEKRYVQLAEDFKKPLAQFMDYFDLLPISPKFFEDIEFYAKNVYKQRQFVAEIEALSKISGYPFSKIFFLNFMYEYSTFKACTGILLRNSQGKIMHGRNLDFEMWGLLSKLLARIDYYKGGKRIFSADSVVGSVFILTGIRHGAFSVNVDTRTENHVYDDFISVLIDNAPPTCWVLRKVLQEETTYAGALNRLKRERIGAPVYYIIAGINDGCVIEREPNSVHAFYELNETNWFIVQTNYDREYPDPLHDPRRIPVEKKIRERGNVDFTQKTLMNDFMSHWPTFNIATIMTGIMVPSEGYHNTTVWYGQNPQVKQVEELIM